MKNYIKPTVEIVELFAKENIAANEYAQEYVEGLTTYAFRNSFTAPQTSTPIV